MGGEEDTVRRMRAGQLQAATLNPGGLSGIDPAIGAVQKIAMLYRSLDVSQRPGRLEVDARGRQAYGFAQG